MNAKGAMVIGLIILIFLIDINPMAFSAMITPKRPVYNTEYYTEPVYGMVYYGTLTDSGAFLQSDKTWSFDNAVGFDMLYTRTASRDEYTVTITNFGGTQSYYYDIDIFDVRQKPGIVRYEEKTRQVCVENCNLTCRVNFYAINITLGGIYCAG